MPTVATCLWFAHDGEEAARFYVSLLPNSSIDRVVRSPLDWPAGRAGDVLLVDFTLGGVAMQALNGGEGTPPTNAASISVTCDTQDEVDWLWAALLAGGGKEVQCGWLNDRWGVPWQIVPAVMTRLLADPDPARAARAMAAMMTMVKLDGPAIAAAAG